jgi:hypothetical protein
VTRELHLPNRALDDQVRYLDKGDLLMSIAAAKDAQAHSGQAIPLGLAVWFLPLLAADAERLTSGRSGGSHAG